MPSGTSGALALLAALCVACASAPRRDHGQADATVDALRVKNPDLGALFDRAAGYVVVSLAGATAAVDGVARDPGVVYRAGERVGECDLVRPAPTSPLVRVLDHWVVFFLDAGLLDALASGPVELPLQTFAPEVDVETVLAAGEAAGVVVVTTFRGGLLQGEPLGRGRLEPRRAD